MDVVFFVALLSTALALGGALAHLYELPNKIGLPQDRYIIVQDIYRGWWQFAYLLGVQFLSMLAVIVLSHGQPRVVWPAVVALACLIAGQVVFWVYTYPANVATTNWTTQPGQLGGIAPPVGVLARGRCSVPVPGDERAHCRGAGARATTATRSRWR